jgi:hypothetical protein
LDANEGILSTGESQKVNSASIDFAGGFSDAKEKLLKDLAVSVAARI